MDLACCCCRGVLKISDVLVRRSRGLRDCGALIVSDVLSVAEATVARASSSEMERNVSTVHHLGGSLHTCDGKDLFLQFRTFRTHPAHRKRILNLFAVQTRTEACLDKDASTMIFGATRWSAWGW